MTDAYDLYPRTVKKSEWEAFLGRDLETFEKVLLHETAVEIKFNRSKMKPLYEKLLYHNMTIPMLTGLHGNCFFESLVWYKFADDPDTLRSAVAYLMYQFKDFPNFIPGQELTMEQLFDMETYEEIQYVVCEKDLKLYKNSYDIMCMDLGCPRSWSILPTNLIMLAISRLFNVRFHIIKDTNEEDTEFRVVDAYENAPEDYVKPPMRDIYLAHILESHFLPVHFLKKSSEKLYYNEAKITFHRWGEAMARKKKKEEEEEKLEQIPMSNRFAGFIDFN